MTRPPIPTGDNAAAMQFLERWKPGGPWTLTAIDPNKKGITTATFEGGPHFGKLGRWLDQWNNVRNIYYSVNSTTRALTKKARREDIAALNWLHIDIDPRAGEDINQERERALTLLTDRLPEGVPPPTVIIFSGGGYQGFWKLVEPFEIDGDIVKAEEAKLWNLALELKLGGDNCHNVDRIMRLPGTVNLPDARKRKKGRVPTLATLVSFDPERVYSFDEFDKAEPNTRAAAPKPANRLDEIDLEKKGLDKLARKVIAQGDDPDKPGRWGGDRSLAVLFVCCAMVRAKFTDAEIIAVISDPDWAISEHVLEQKNSKVYAQRQAERARLKVEDEFSTDEHGRPHKTQRNTRLAIQKLGVHLRYNDFTCKKEITGLPEHGPILQDKALTIMRLAIEEKYQLSIPKERFGDIVEDFALRDRHNPILDYLNSLSWDGTARLDKWLHTYGGAADGDYTRAVGSIPLIAACRRVREPGVKFDEMLVFISHQGLNKSSAIKLLAPDAAYFSDCLPLGAKAQEVCEQIAGKWIIEFAELHGMTANKIERIKAFLSRQVDGARLAYGRIPEEFPRQCVFIGTTNTPKFMNDQTGGRRFWPVDVKRFDLDALRRDRDQLWAEAAHREESGESIRLDPELYAVAGKHQAEHRTDNQFIPIIAAAIGEIDGKIASASIWTILGIPAQHRTQAYNDLMGEAMKMLGWKKSKIRLTGMKNPVHGYKHGKGPRFPEIKITKDRDGLWGVHRSTAGTVEELKRMLKAEEEQLAFEKEMEQRRGEDHERGD